MNRQLLIGALAAGTLIGAGVMPAQAATVTSGGSPVGGWDVQGRARNGRSGFEAQLITPANPTPGVTLNPAGTPVWVFGQAYNFQFDYTFANGGATWSIDFNNDGDFTDPQETATSVSPTLAGQSFKYAGIFLQGSDGANPSTATLNNLVINGTNFGPYGPAGNTSFEQNFEDTSGLFGNITATGSFTFSANGGSDERPRFWFRVGEEYPVPDGDIIPTPAMLPGLIGMGIAAWRKRKAAAAAETADN